MEETKTVSTELVKLLPVEAIHEHEKYKSCVKTVRQAQQAMVKVDKITAENFATGANILAKLKKSVKSIDASRIELTRPLNESKKVIKAEFDKFVNSLTGMQKELNNKLIDYKTEEERKEQERLRKLREEEERLRQEAIKAEQERLAKEQPELSEEDIKAEAEIMTPEVMPEIEPQEIKRVKTEISTTTFKKTIKAEVKTDRDSICELLLAIIDGKMPITAIKVSNQEITKHLKNLGFEIQERGKYPYLNITEEQSIISRS